MAAVRTTARFGSLAVGVQTSQYGDVSRTIAFSVPIRFSEGDLVAALWMHARSLTSAELADVDSVRELVADAIVNGGLDEIDQAREQLSGLAPGTAEHAWSLEIVDAVRRAFALAVPDTSPGSGSGRALVAVSS